MNCSVIADKSWSYGKNGHNYDKYFLYIPSKTKLKVELPGLTKETLQIEELLSNKVKQEM